MAQDAVGVSDIWRTEQVFDSSQFTFLQSASGKGKSTLLHIFYGVRRDFEGEVLVDNEPIRSFSLARWADWRKGEVALLFQDLKLFGELTALENIRLKAELTNNFDQGKVEAWAEQLEVKHLLGKPCSQLSLGQQQRMALLRALSQPFKWLLMDEPFSHLDVENIKKACGLIKEVCAERQAGLVLTSLGEKYFLDYDRELKI